MAEPLKHELHDAAKALTAVIETEAAGIAVAHKVMHRTPDGPWLECGHGGDQPQSTSGYYECMVPALPNRSIVRGLFIAVGRQEGDKFRVIFRLEQSARILKDEPPFDETLKLGEGARLEWAWRYVLE